MFRLGDRVIEKDSNETYFDLPAGTVESVETGADGKRFYGIKWDGDKVIDTWEYTDADLVFAGVTV